MSVLKTYNLISYGIVRRPSPFFLDFGQKMVLRMDPFYVSKPNSNFTSPRVAPSNH